MKTFCGLFFTDFFILQKSFSSCISFYLRINQKHSGFFVGISPRLHVK